MQWAVSDELGVQSRVPRFRSGLDSRVVVGTTGRMATKWSARIAENCLGRRARVLDRCVSGIYNHALAPHGLKMTQMTLLVAIDLSSPVVAADLGRRLHIEKSTLSRNLRRIEEQGWVTQRGGLRLTAAGRKQIEAAGPDWAKAQAEAETMLGASGAQSLQRMLRRIKSH